ncbi:MAG: hypothetical protein ACE5WD_06465 [Candidatus Aminicenantia bacterium]
MWLREKHNPSLSYNGSFIINYLEKLIYLKISREIIFGFTIGIVAISVSLYFKQFNQLRFYLKKKR